MYLQAAKFPIYYNLDSGRTQEAMPRRPPPDVRAQPRAAANPLWGHPPVATPPDVRVQPRATAALLGRFLWSCSKKASQTPKGNPLATVSHDHATTQPGTVSYRAERTCVSAQPSSADACNVGIRCSDDVWRNPAGCRPLCGGAFFGLGFPCKGAPLHGEGGAAKRLRLRACPEAKDVQLATTQSVPDPERKSACYRIPRPSSHTAKYRIPQGRKD